MTAHLLGSHTSSCVPHPLLHPSPVHEGIDVRTPPCQCSTPPLYMKLLLSERLPASIQVQSETHNHTLSTRVASVQHSHLCPCRYLWGLLGVTGGAYAGTAALAGVLFYFFNSTSQDCSFNVTIIVATIVLGLVYVSHICVWPGSVSATRRMLVLAKSS